ncbi:hypothetical protein GGE45_001520 [Rhizobium aethiopicum]|uniref:hypothetical protein n=1 Tax=Rhizobium aethiopicum TaxID=1138170 RepID=UPI0016190237|nr:hypothetical protein [Rhizobium aethiopicum]MBB4579200.1 hypothetical protein [Rhizobium aethiopicum]
MALAILNKAFPSSDAALRRTHVKHKKQDHVAADIMSAPAFAAHRHSHRAPETGPSNRTFWRRFFALRPRLGENYRRGARQLLRGFIGAFKQTATPFSETVRPLFSRGSRIPLTVSSEKQQKSLFLALLHPMLHSRRRQDTDLLHPFRGIENKR